MAASIEASGSTLKIFYLRFISDAAPGLILILVAVALHGRVSLLSMSGAGTAVKALMAIIALLLAVPAGLVLNGASHVVLGAVQTWVNQQCFRFRGWPMYDTHRSSLTTEWSRCFGLERKQWPLMAEIVDELLLIHVRQVAEALDHVRAFKKFLRSLAFLALAGLVVRTLVMLEIDGLSWALLVSASCAIALGGYITFYQQASGMLRAYILCGLPQDPVTMSIAELRQHLIDYSRKSAGKDESARE